LGSRILKFEPGFHWTDALRRVYKEESTGWQGVSRTSLVGGTDQPAETAFAEPSHPPFHVRYFEVEPGGFTTREQHAHEHVVVVLRGAGLAELGNETAPLGFGDVVYVAPWEVHRFRCEAGNEPLGFLCIVPAERDQPQALSDD
jgi:quercetin dioxygenase-like cupin family protein